MTATAVLHKERKRRERKTKRGAVTLEVNVKRQLSAEIGEDELPQGEKFILLQKYGVAAPRIDRLVTKPVWMEERLWRQKNNDWMRATKGLVPAKQQPRTQAQQRHQQSQRPTTRTSRQS